MAKPPAHDPQPAEGPQAPHASLLEAFSGYLTQTTGLYFGPDRQTDFKRAVLAITRDLGSSSSNECIASLMRDPLTPERLATLAKHLTVPETYFLRDTACLDTLALQVLPSLIKDRRQTTRRIRAWSVACCTGEEAYSIAITLARAIPDWQKWDISVLATDINPVCLAKGRQGIYSEWSFRGAPGWLKPDFMNPVPQSALDGPIHWQVKSQIKELVRFESLNLADENYPGQVSDMDLIFCANVLMYFSDAQARATVRKLARMQADGGWLILGPNDIPSALPSTYRPVAMEKATLYRKLPFEDAAPVPVAPEIRALPTLARIAHRPALASPSLPAVQAKPPAPVAPTPPVPETGELARSLADQGKLREALKACDVWVSRDKSNPCSHYLRAVILVEMGNASQAAADLRKCLYLNPDFVMAHFTAGHLALSTGHTSQARKHMSNVVRLLNGKPQDDIVPESAEITVQRLSQLASQFLTTEASR